MIKIFNKKLGKGIEIDETDPMINFAPREYELENPHIRLKLSGFDFNRHSKICEECGAFRKDFGSLSIDWFISYGGKTFRLNLEKFGSKYMDNLNRRTNSADFYGSELKLNLDISTVESLTEQLEMEIAMENFEKCCTLRDKISGLKD